MIDVGDEQRGANEGLNNSRPAVSAAAARTAAVEPAEAAHRKQRKDYLVGIALLLLVVLLWTGSNFLTKQILTSGWDKPWAVTYANTASFTLYLIPFALNLGSKSPRNRRRGRACRTLRTQKSFWARHGFTLPECSPPTSRGYSPLPVHDADVEAHMSLRHPDMRSSEAIEDGIASLVIRPSRLCPVSPDAHCPIMIRGGRPSSIDGRRPVSRLLDTSENDNGFTTTNRSLVSLPDAVSAAAAPPVLPPLTLRETAVLAAQFTVVWFAANWSLNAGLGMTSVASGTTLSSTSGFFTLALGSFTGVERFSKLKLLATAISFFGVVLVTHADSAPPPPLLIKSELEQATMAATVMNPTNVPLGDALSLLSAFCYALYVTLLKLRIQSEDRVSMPLFFGFVGALNVVLLWPIGLVLHLTSIEPFELPRDMATWVCIGFNMVITFVSDFAYLLSMLRTAPLVATVGLSLTIPLAVAIDLISGTHSGGMTANFGSLTVLLSFLAIGWDDSKLLEVGDLAAKDEQDEDGDLSGSERSGDGDDEGEGEFDFEVRRCAESR